MPALCPDDIVFRMDLAAASLGATYFHVEGYFQPFYAYGPKGLKVHPRAKRHRALLYELMRKNIVLPVDKDQLMSLSPCAFRLVRSRNRDYTYRWYRRGGTKKEGLFNFKFCMQTVSDYYASSYLYKLRHYFEGLFPQTPYGFIRLFPETVEISKVSTVQSFITTDGTDVRRAGRVISATEAKKLVESEFRKASAALPFKADGVFLSAQRWGADYLLYIIDPGYLNPVGVNTEVRIGVPGKEFFAEDWLTRRPIELKGRKFSLSVPAGSFRIVRVRAR